MVVAIRPNFGGTESVKAWKVTDAAATATATGCHEKLDVLKATACVRFEDPVVREVSQADNCFAY